MHVPVIGEVPATRPLPPLPPAAVPLRAASSSLSLSTSTADDDVGAAAAGVGDTAARAAFVAIVPPIQAAVWEIGQESDPERPA